MGQKYSMKAASKITGLTPDTIRIWERRYQAVTPLREESGRRFYSDIEVERLTLLREATELGMPIRRIAPMENQELKRLLADRGGAKGGEQAEAALVANILKSLEAFDVGMLDRFLGMAVASLPPESLADRILFPCLRRVGDLWHEGKLSIAQEHLISGRLRSLTGVLMQFSPRRAGGEAACFATLSGERHEFGILLCCWLASVRGWRTLYLGPDLPAEDIAAAARSAGCSLVALSAIHAGEGAAAQGEQLRGLRAELAPEIAIWIGGAAAERVQESAGRPRGVQTAELDSFIRRLDRAPNGSAGPGDER